jgi:hypothetical protein
LLSPASNSITTDYTPIFDWADATLSPDHYHFQLSTSSTFASTVIDDSAVPGSTYTPLSDLAPNSTFYWRVRSVNAAGSYSLWSAYRSIRTAVLPPSLSSPDHGATPTSLRPAFDWDDVPGATSYTIQISTNNMFTAFVVNASASTSSYTPSINLPTYKVLDWRVRANAPNGPSDWSEVRTFVIIP